VELASLLDEGGSVIEGFLPGVDTPVAVIGISEKGYLSLRLTVTVDGGHSSMPPQETAIGILSKAITSLETKPMSAHLEVVEFLMSYLGSALPFFQRMLFANTWLFGGLLKKQLTKSKLLNAMIRTTTAPTIIEAGVKDNVLPGKAEAVVNFRLLPGDDLRTVYEEVIARINDDRVVATPYEGETLEGGAGWNPSPVADAESPYFHTLTNLIKSTFPGALVSPYLVMGGTDARHYTSVTDCALRFSPISMTQEDLQRVHGVDERLSFENCSRMVQFYIAYIQELSSMNGELDAFSATTSEIAPLEEDDLVPSMEEMAQFQEEQKAEADTLEDEIVPVEEDDLIPSMEDMLQFQEDQKAEANTLEEEIGEEEPPEA
jgi:carboxypeptidase PM20D1